MTELVAIRAASSLLTLDLLIGTQFFNSDRGGAPLLYLT